MNAQHYMYHAIWSPEDHQFVGLCAELPSLSWLAPSQQEALAGIVTVASEVVADLQEQGEPVPHASRTTNPANKGKPYAHGPGASFGNTHIQG